MVKRVAGADGIEVVYPGEFADPTRAVALIQDAGLPVSAVNLDVKSAKHWQTGSFTSSDARLRAQAVADLKAAMDLAVELGTQMVTCCPLIDGHNYAFEVDYARQWQWLEEGIGQGASHRPGIKLSLEYKLNESRNFVVLGDVGRTLYLCERLGLPNVGVTLDVGHALIARETPAESLCLAAGAGRLFYVHLNDNAREWDWDMIPGSVNLWDVVETMFYLDRLDWEGWVSYDVLSRAGEPVETIETAIAAVKVAQELLTKIGAEQLQAFIDEGRPDRTFRYLLEALL
jgi:xylose isomerase